MVIKSAIYEITDRRLSNRVFTLGDITQGGCWVETVIDFKLFY